MRGSVFDIHVLSIKALHVKSHIDLIKLFNCYHLYKSDSHISIIYSPVGWIDHEPRANLHWSAALAVHIAKDGTRCFAPRAITGGIAMIRANSFLRFATAALCMTAGLLMSAANAETLRVGAPRSEERRVGKECVSTGRSRGAPDHIQ